MQEAVKYTIFKTKWGYFGLAGTEFGLLRTHLPGPEPEKVKSHLLKDLRLANRVSSIEHRDSRIEFDKTLFKALQGQITAYFEGDCVNFSPNIPIVLEGFSLFVRCVLTACRDIRYGQTISYSQLAERVGRAAAVRAVGGALARNPLPLIIPCHRIAYANGQIGGFSAPGGKKLKEKLLRQEQNLT